MRSVWLVGPHRRGRWRKHFCKMKRLDSPCLLRNRKRRNATKLLHAGTGKCLLGSSQEELSRSIDVRTCHIRGVGLLPILVVRAVASCISSSNGELH